MEVERAGFDHPTNVAPNGELRWHYTPIDDGDDIIINGAFFDVGGYAVKNGSAAWFQPGIAAHGEKVDGQNIVGFVINIVDHIGSAILVPGNEPFKTGHHALRLALQTSWAKLNAVINGDTAKDANLAKLLGVWGGAARLEELEWKLRDSAHDGNRVGGGLVAYAKIAMETAELEKLAVEIGGAAFRDFELSILKEQTSFLNSHALYCI
jgi:hypothetical protein